MIKASLVRNYLHDSIIGIFGLLILIPLVLTHNDLLIGWAVSLILLAASGCFVYLTWSRNRRFVK